MEKTSESLSQSWDNLTFANNYLFCKILESDKELCRKLLELLLHIKIDHLEFPETERSMQPSTIQNPCDLMYTQKVITKSLT